MFLGGIQQFWEKKKYPLCYCRLTASYTEVGEGSVGKSSCGSSYVPGLEYDLSQLLLSKAAVKGDGTGLKKALQTVADKLGQKRG